MGNRAPLIFGNKVEELKIRNHDLASNFTAEQIISKIVLYSLILDEDYNQFQKCNRGLYMERVLLSTEQFSNNP